MRKSWVNLKADLSIALLNVFPRPSTLIAWARRVFLTCFGFIFMAALSGCALLDGPLAPYSALTKAPMIKSYYTTIQSQSGPVKLYVREEGRRDGSLPPLVMIHGYGGNHYTWRAIAPMLAKRYRVISIDLKGFGRSDKPLDNHYAIFDQAELVAAFILQKNLRDVTLVGHSFGGGVALAIAAAKKKNVPNRLKKVVLLDSLAYAQALPSFIRFLKLPVIAELGMTVVPPEIQAHAALRYAYHDDSKIQWDTVKAYAAPLYSIGGKYAAIRTAEQIVPQNIKSFVKGYKKIKVPTLLIWCEHDKIVPIFNGLRLNSEIPKSRLHIIKGCGHAPQEENPVETAQLIADFLR